MKIVDSILFFNETEILKLRLSELYDFVDFFVIVEADKTHSGLDKEFNFEKVKEEFSPWVDKIKYFKITLDESTPMGRENEHRIKIYDCLKKLSLDDEDRVMVSDCDEIPNKKTVLSLIESGIQYANLLQLYFVYYLNFYSQKAVTGTSLITWDRLKTTQNLNGRATQWLRNRKDYGYIAQNGGWHYSYLCGAERMKKKAESFCHAEDVVETGARSKDNPLDYFEGQLKAAIENNYTPYSHNSISRVNFVGDRSQYISTSTLLAGKTSELYSETWDVYPESLYFEKYREMIYNEG